MTSPSPAYDPYTPTQLPDGPLFRWVVPYLAGWIALVLLPLCLVAGISLTAWAIAFGLWAVSAAGQRLIGLYINGLPQAMAVGAAGLSMLMRAWGIAFVLFAVGADMQIGDSHFGMGQPELAVPAMIIFLLLVTVDIGVRALTELNRYRSHIPTPPSEESA